VHQRGAGGEGECNINLVNSGVVLFRFRFFFCCSSLFAKTKRGEMRIYDLAPSRFLVGADDAPLHVHSHGTSEQAARDNSALKLRSRVFLTHDI
jgi:hypothetical protein